MKTLRVLILAGFLTGFAAAQPERPTALPNPPNAPTASALESQCWNTLKSLTKYQAQLVRLAEGTAPVETRLARSDNRLRLDMNSRSKNSDMRFTIVYDGEWQYCAARTQDAGHVSKENLKVNLAKTLAPGTLFDTFFELKGSGLTPGQDYVGTIQSVLETCDLTFGGAAQVQHHRCWVLQAHPNKEKQKRWLESHWRRYRDGSEPDVTLYLDQKNGFVWEYATKDVRTVVEEFSDEEPSALVFQPPKHEYTDATNDVLAHRLHELLGVPAGLDQFLTRNPEVLKADLDHGPPLLQTAAEGNVEAAKVLVKHGSQLNARNQAGETALHLAARQGQLNMLEWLLSQKLDPEAKDNQGETPLHEAGRSGRKQAYDFLSKHGASKKAKDSKGRVPVLQKTAGPQSMRVHP